jgi:uncharacterized protein YdeI (YjbR/CyaY-like superfamily)
MQITETFKPNSRAEWRTWLEQNHSVKTEIWLVYTRQAKFRAISYLDSVEEALCFGWIDSTNKGLNELDTAQRFTPRKAKSNWTELNKARARRLIKLGMMTKSGQACLPDLTRSKQVPEYIITALATEPNALENFQKFPPLYQRVRVSYIDEMRKRPEELGKRLNNFVQRTGKGELFGNWNDGGRLSDDE